MKKPKVHQFKYADPEKATGEAVSKKTSEKATPKTSPMDPAISSDLKKTAFLIATFALAAGVLYLIQIKTGLLAPVLKLFGI